MPASQRRGSIAASGSVASLTYAQTVAADSPVAYWKMDEASGNLTDSSGNGMTLTKQGVGQTYQVTGPGTGQFGITFVRANSNYFNRVSIQATPLGVADVFTSEVWIKRASISTDQALMDRGGTAFATYLQGSDNKLDLQKRATAGIVVATTALTDTTGWHHIVVTKNGATVKMYIDNTDVTGSVSNQTMINANTDFSLGGGGIGFFDGSMSHAAVYSTALSAARVSAHFTAMV